MRDIKGFIVKQAGALSLTENLGGDPSFLLPVEVDVEYTDGKVLSIDDIDRIYYHSSEGWKPINKAGDEVFGVTDMLPSDVRDSDKINDIEIALDRLGNEVLAKTVEMAEGLWGEHVGYLEVHDDDL